LIRLPPEIRIPHDSSSDVENHVHAFVARREQVLEDERVDQQQQKRIDEGPEEAEHGTAISRFQLPRHQALYQASVAK
jgi:hypothetical protein